MLSDGKHDKVACLTNKTNASDFFKEVNNYMKNVNLYEPHEQESVTGGVVVD